MMQTCIQKLVEGANLSLDESMQVMQEILTGKATYAQTGAFLTALRIKGETIEELLAFANVMKSQCLQIRPQVQGRLVDTCGTGGDSIKTFNVSTVAAFVIAGAGIPVAKHGNRAMTSKNGSADVLEKLGLNLVMTPRDVQLAIEKVGIGFMFAPVFHPALRVVAQTRKEIAVRTVFNVLGPLANPANAVGQLLGVYESRLVMPLAKVLNYLGCKEAMVVHGLDGLDEISTLGKTCIAHLKSGQIKKLEVSPDFFGVKQANAIDLSVSNVEESAQIIYNILSGKNLNDPKAEMVLVNSAAGIIVGGKANNFPEAIQIARESILSGAAYGKLKELISISGGSLQNLEELASV
ncbi:MAG: anthranilate phosphoribosyltransferase [Candidatus Bathyarchaeota archaeon]|nr:anthranilate phosphoribosyltransferase [Candidatus Termiticorpusculum sp.]MCL1970767.1 anthranilate phosphoribosyltransferase [Candidatus Termiticorpusculum sp.]